VAKEPCSVIVAVMQIHTRLGELKKNLIDNHAIVLHVSGYPFYEENQFHSIFVKIKSAKGKYFWGNLDPGVQVMKSAPQRILCVLHCIDLLLNREGELELLFPGNSNC
jgi:hypothetical protein